MKIEVYENKNDITKTIMVDANGAQYACKHHPMRVRAAVLKSVANLASRQADGDLVRMDRGVELSTLTRLMVVEVKDE